MAAALYADSCKALILHEALRSFAADRIHMHWILEQALQVGHAKYSSGDWHHSKPTLPE